MPPYDNYQDAFEHENIKKIKAEIEELEARRKLESSLNTLAVFAIIGIVAVITLVAIVVLGADSGSYSH